MTTHRIHVLAALAGLLLLGAGGTASAQSTITCESRNGQYQACSANTSGGVTLSRQLSSQGCWQNDTWGYDRNRVWVTRGCRAEFRVGGTSSSNNTGAKVAGALVLGAVFLWYAWKLLDPPDEFFAMRAFKYSIVYLMALFAFLLLDHWLLPFLQPAAALEFLPSA